MNTGEAILRLAGIIPEHNLKEVRALANFNTWGVDSRPGQLPSILYIGEGSRDFGPPCWPFMAAHEAMHSIATFHLHTDDYHFLLYNICEDWRVNECLLGVFDEKLAKSFRETRLAILRRWEKEPLKLKSPVSQVLQHLCYLNHLSAKGPRLNASNDYLKEVLRIREEFGSAENWPLVPPNPDRFEREQENERIGKRLARIILGHRLPPRICPAELRVLMVRAGYDLSFRRGLTAPRGPENASDGPSRNPATQIEE